MENKLRDRSKTERKMRQNGNQQKISTIDSIATTLTRMDDENWVL